MQTVIWVNGKYVVADREMIRADDAAVLFGRGIYETFRMRRARVYRLDQHLSRMREGAKVTGVTLPEEEIRSVIRTLWQEDSRVRVTVTAGPAGGPPTLIIQARAATDYPAEMYERGMSALISPVRRNETSPLAGVKSLNCLDNIMSREWACSEGADTALLLNTKGLLAEASTANVFVVRDGGLVTPPVTDGALPGVTRGAILDLAREAGIQTEEQSMKVEELIAAGEAFLTGAVMGVMPLVEVNGRAIGDGKQGMVTRQMRVLYEEAVREATLG